MSSTVVPVKTYVFVWIALLSLLALTVGVAFVPLHSFNVVAALLIAFAKMALIVLFFMHAKYSSRIILVFVFAGLFWLGILFTLSMGDYLTRFSLPTPTVWRNSR